MEPASGSVKKLDKTALEGLDARTESTKVPESALESLEDPQDPPSENETCTSTKRSQSKPEHGRGPKREAKQARKALIHKGILSKAEADQLDAQQILALKKKYRQGSSKLSEVLLQQLAENQKEDLFQKLFGGHQECPEMKIPSDEQVAQADRILMAKYILDEMHLHNKDHRRYMKEHLQSHYLLTDPSLMNTEDVEHSFLRVRRFGGGLKSLSLAGSLEYWGDVERLPSLVRSMHATRAMKVKYGQSSTAKTYDLEKEQVAKYHLAWVSYAATSGKYTNATYSKDHLPEDEDFDDIEGVLATRTILIICWYQIMEDGFWVWVMTIEEV
ncbi:unnamed protein product [Symbiodinium natans]|uniref:Uncharacterized protein n=1 Tax=Symbiodinium natans TaxID=878477 RepID=A0A812GUK3_9DINO|nr:unnamed protein product [Symbiodinium natans]